MTDREKVVWNLGILRTWAEVNANYGIGLSVADCDQAVKWLDAALALLKAQEPVKPVFERQFMSNIELYDCGTCGTSLGAKGIAKYCMACGQAVKWDG